MRVLFVSSGNSKFGVSPVVQNQGRSLRKQGIDIEYFSIKGKGLIGYLKNVLPLRKFIKENNFDIIHAHYSLTAFVASMARAKPLVVSLMGSDVKSDNLLRILIRIFNKLSWSKIIVKSQDMKESLGINSVEIIPNGVDYDKFKPLNQLECKKQLEWDFSKKQILFAANPKRYEKNYQLAIDSINILQDGNIELKVLQDVPNELMIVYYNSADAVLLTSLWEGSPNVIKEAMACNIPIVSTDVGDVQEVIGDTKGCYITSFDPKDVAEKLKMALNFGKRTNGREKIKHLEASVIAKRIINIYNQVLEKQN